MPKVLEEKLKREYPNNPHAIAWAAGLFEGEGSIAARSIAITQKDIWCLHRLKALFGGQVGNKRQDGTSQWWLCGQSGRDFVASIQPWLSPRRQAQLAATFLNDDAMAERRRIHRDNCRRRTASRSRDRFGRLASA